MTLRLTPDVLASGYSFLRSCEPFCRWGLPPAHKIKFRVVRARDIHADFSVIKGHPVIRVSANGAGHTVTVLSSLSHEMIHLRQYLTGDRETHGPRFHKMAATICSRHGFDPMIF